MSQLSESCRLFNLNENQRTSRPGLLDYSVKFIVFYEIKFIQLHSISF